MIKLLARILGVTEYDVWTLIQLQLTMFALVFIGLAIGAILVNGL